MRHLLISHRNKHIDRSWGTLLPLDRIVWKEGNTRAAMRRAINIAKACIEMGQEYYEFNEMSKGLEFMYAKKGYEDRFATAWQRHKESQQTTHRPEPPMGARKRAREEASAEEPASSKAQRTEAAHKDRPGNVGQSQATCNMPPPQTRSNKAAKKQGGTASAEDGAGTTAGEAATGAAAGEDGTSPTAQARKAALAAEKKAAAAQNKEEKRQGNGDRQAESGSGTEQARKRAREEELAQRKEERRQARKVAHKLKEDKIKAVNEAMNLKARYSLAVSTANTILKCVVQAVPGEAWHWARANQDVTKPLEDAKNVMLTAVQPRSFLAAFISCELSDVEKAYAEETFKTEIAKVPIALTDRIVELERCNARVAKMHREFMAKCT